MHERHGARHCTPSMTFDRLARPLVRVRAEYIRSSVSLVCLIHFPHISSSNTQPPHT